MKKITEYEYLAKKALEAIEEKADEARESGDDVTDLYKTVTNSAKLLTEAIIRPLIEFHNGNTLSGTGTSFFSYTVYYFVLEYVGQILDAATGEMEKSFPQETRMTAKMNAIIAPIKTDIIKPL